MYNTIVSVSIVLPRSLERNTDFWANVYKCVLVYIVYN